MIVRVLAAASVLVVPAVRPDVEEQFTFVDPRIGESSGLVDRRQDVLTINDSGDTARVFVVAKDSGATVGITTYSSAPVVDVEAIAMGPRGTVYVGDIGDNSAERDTIAVYVLAKVGRGDHNASAQRYDFRYEAGPRDAEALLVQPETGRIFIASKGALGGQLYAAPEKLSAHSVNVLKPVGSVGALVTDGQFFPGGDYAVLRNYFTASIYQAAPWKVLDRFELPDQQQGEGLALTEKGRRLLLSSEGVHSAVLNVRVPPEVSAVALQGIATPSVTPSGSPTPTAAEEKPPAETETPAQQADWPVWAGVAILAALAGTMVRGARRRSRSKQ